MIPSFGGGLTNSGSLPINAGGGTSGPSSATSANDIGGIRNGNVYLGGSPIPTWVWLLFAAGAAWWVLKK